MATQRRSGTWEATREGVYLDLAKHVADNAIAKQFHKGFFVRSQDHVIAGFDDPLPLALLHLRAAGVRSHLSENPIPDYVKLNDIITTGGFTLTNLQNNNMLKLLIILITLFISISLKAQYDNEPHALF